MDLWSEGVDHTGDPNLRQTRSQRWANLVLSLRCIDRWCDMKRGLMFPHHSSGEAGCLRLFRPAGQPSEAREGRRRIRSEYVIQVTDLREKAEASGVSGLGSRGYCRGCLGAHDDVPWNALPGATTGSGAEVGTAKGPRINALKITTLDLAQCDLMTINTKKDAVLARLDQEMAGSRYVPHLAVGDVSRPATMVSFRA